MRGFDKHSLNIQLLYALSLDEYAAGATPPSYDKAKPHHTSTLHGGSWNSLASGLPYFDLSPNPDWIDCPAADTADLDFTTEDFSMAIWANPDTFGGQNMLMCRGLVLTDGWRFSIIANALVLTTSQAGVYQSSQSEAILATGAWQLCGLSRSGASVSLIIQGLNQTAVAATHIDPVTANRKLHIGVYDDEVTAAFDGKIAGGKCSPRIWGRALADWEWLQLFHMEKDWLGV